MMMARPLAAMFGLTGLCLIGAALVPAAAQGSGGLAPHRAVYDLQLDQASDRSGITGLYGRMVYEFNGSPCDGYTVNFRFVTRIDTDEVSRVTDQQTTTYEDLEAGTFRFVTRSYVDEQLDTEISGSASGDADGVRVAIDKPEARTFDLTAGLFPTDHMIELIDKAKAGERFYESRIYDGSEDGDKVMLTTTVIGAPQTPEGDDAEAAEAGSFADDRFWPVSIAYFEDASVGDELPTYRISFKLYENGLTRDLAMDYGDFTLTGTLSELEMYDPVACEE
jgi:hypothetical protein